MHKNPKKKGYTCCLTLSDVGGLVQYQQTACVTLLQNAAKRHVGHLIMKINQAASQPW
jgi:hypothetical protein